MANILRQLNRAQRREAGKSLQKESDKQSKTLQEVPSDKWPSHAANLRRVLRSRQFLVQEYQEANGYTRLSINRSTLGAGGNWQGEITWDELQQVKVECGYADRWATELYPAANKLVNVANMRHLWLLPAPPAYGWQ